MFIILGATGNTGKVIARTLLAQNRPVRVVLRDAATAQAWTDRGAEIAIADVEDRAALERALRGAEGAYLLLPPAFHSSQVRVDNDRRANNLAAAIESVGVKHVVMLSSIGAQHAEGTGPVLSLHDAEATLGRALSGANRTRGVTFLRAAYFMENWALALSAVGQGIMPSFLLTDRAIPMVATRDIGLAAARLLVEGGTGTRVIQVAGPREYSPHDVAIALGRVVGKTVVVEQQPEAVMASVLLAAGMNTGWARLFQELAHGVNTGRVAWEDGHALWRGETDVEEVLASLVGAG